MKKTAVIAVLILFMTSGLVFAEVFKIDQQLKSVSQTTRDFVTKDKESGKLLWKGRVSLAQISRENEPLLYIQEEGSGIYGNDKEYKSWISKAYYHLKENRAIPFQTQLIYKNIKGKVIQAIEKFYYPNKGKVECKINQEAKNFDYQNDLIDREILATALMCYPFSEKRDFEFHLLTNSPEVFKMTLKYRGVENLEIGAASIVCHKLEMIPDLGILNLLGAFVPKTYFWYTASTPHTFVKYEGLESGLGTPYVIMEATW